MCLCVRVHPNAEGKSSLNLEPRSSCMGTSVFVIKAVGKTTRVRPALLQSLARSLAGGQSYRPVSL